MKRNEYIETLQNLKYFIEESDDIEEIKKQFMFLINMNMNCMETIHNLKTELKNIHIFLADENVISHKLIKKDITEN